jgi:hypothetical protein
MNIDHSELMLEWEEEGKEQPGKYTTKTLREQHLSYPWATFSIGTYDGTKSDFHDWPCILPSNQYDACKTNHPIYSSIHNNITIMLTYVYECMAGAKSPGIRRS